MKKIGLALGSGGWRGGVHIGVIKTLEKHNIPIHYIAGTSAGAIVGGLYAYKKRIDEVEEVYRAFKGKSFATSFFLDIGTKGGFIRGEKFTQYLDTYLEKINIEDTKIPFRALATDILHGEKVELKEGHLAKAMQISSTIPVLFEPTFTNGKYLVDGGLTSPVPVETVRDMGADIVIAVDTLGGIFPIDKKNIEPLTGNKMANIALRLLLENLSRKSTEHADIVINPETPGAETGFLLKLLAEKNIVKYGEEATEKIIPELKKLLD